MSRNRRSGFAQFADQTAREEFVRAVLDPNPDLTGRAYLSESRPTIVFEGLTAGEQRTIVAALKGVGRWFDDAQNDPTAANPA